MNKRGSPGWCPVKNISNEESRSSNRKTPGENESRSKECLEWQKIKHNPERQVLIAWQSILWTAKKHYLARADSIIRFAAFFSHWRIIRRIIIIQPLIYLIRARTKESERVSLKKNNFHANSERNRDSKFGIASRAKKIWSASSFGNTSSWLPIEHFKGLE